MNVEELKIFRTQNDALTYNENGDNILKEKCIVLPSAFHPINLANVRHPDISKTKALLRSKVYFLYVEQVVEEAKGLRIPCQSVTKPKAWTPLLLSQLLPKQV